MITIFLVSLFTTFIVIRTLTHMLDIPKKEICKTPTFKIRVKTGWDIHHIHLGFILLMITMLITLIYGLTKNQIIFYSISLSLIADQIAPLLFKKICYFSRKGISLAIILHLIIALISIIIL